MALTFHGKWIVEVKSLGAVNIKQRFLISGADVGNGVYMGVVGALVQVEGPKWQIAFEFNNPDVPGWHQSDEHKLGAKFLLDEGLVASGASIIDIIVRLRNIDKPLNPFVPIQNLPNFTYSR
jgi:hypothetical protein